MQTGRECDANHRYYVAAIAAVPAEGKIAAIIVCTSCGDSQSREHIVAQNGSEIYLEEKENKKEIK